MLAATTLLAAVLVAADLIARFVISRSSTTLHANPGVWPAHRTPTPSAIPLRSGTDWLVYDEDPGRAPGAQRLGVARPVCLNDVAPAACPPEAVRYGWLGFGWAASLSDAGGAVWIGTPDARGDRATDRRPHFFARTFDLGPSPRGRIGLAADDAAEVRVDGRVAGSVGSIVDEVQAFVAQSRLTWFDLTPFLHRGKNVITIAVTNGPYAGCGDACTYARNPTGVVFGGSIIDPR